MTKICGWFMKSCVLDIVIKVLKQFIIHNFMNQLRVQDVLFITNFSDKKLLVIKILVTNLETNL